MQKPQEYLNEVARELNSIPSQEEKLKFLVDIGTDLEELNEDELQPEYKVPGCISNSYVRASLESDEGSIQTSASVKHLEFRGHSDSLIVKGLLAILTNAFSGMTPPEFLDKSDRYLDEFLKTTQIDLNLTPSRANSFGSIFKHMKKQVQSKYAVSI